MLSKKEYIELINNIETNFPVETITYKSLRIWPWLRQILSQTLLTKSTSKPTQISEKEKWNVRDLRYKIKDSYKAYYQVKKKIKSNNPQQEDKRQIDVLYLNTPNGKRELIEGRYFNKFGNSLEFFCKKLELNTKLIEFLATRDFNTEIHGETIYIDASLAKVKINYYWQLLAEKCLVHKTAEIESWTEFMKFLSKHDITFPSSHSVVVEKLDILLLAKKEFYKVLNKYKPKLLFINCFYYDWAFAMVLAANKLSIKTVEFQHGQQGKYHPMYSNWANYPKNGYNLIPSHFWMWGSENAEIIKKWANHSQRHEVVIAGNTWLSINVKGKIRLDSFDKSNLGLKKYRKVVLISLQYSVLPKFLLEAIKAGEHIYWLIRLHPRFSDEVQNIKKILNESIPNQNYELKYANQFNIYSLFKIVDIQITFWSTVAYEALSFGIHTILIHENGKNDMQSYINQRIFYYTENTEQLLEIILNSKKYFKPEVVSYININHKLIKDSLMYILNDSYYNKYILTEAYS
ncbi:hypothetical protein R9C00_25070 [Flammeovirgaceae bacterium SG7u.111]|nr:hypothetical protein [Flammeovirgaceae bacterium SG7u.132]WPO34969.1 hypothetical protein R9C00_25070 [Flammeovirgaceae bacterium SG7u.111]